MFGTLSAGGSAPTDAAIDGAMVLLKIASDPTATRARLDEISAATAELTRAHEQAVTAQLQVKVAQDELADLSTQQAKLIADREELSVAQMVHQGAVSAIADRERDVSAREVKASQREADLTSREKALADRVASYRQALA